MQILLAGLSYKPHYGGIENSFFYMAKVYSSLGHNVVIMVGDKTLSGTGRLPGHEIIEGINVYRFKRLKTKTSILKIFGGIIDIIRSYFYAKRLHNKYGFNFAVMRNANVGLGVTSALKNIKTMYVLPSIESIQDRKSLSEFQGNKISKLVKNSIYNQVLLKQSNLFQRLLIKYSNFNFVFSTNMKKQILQIAPQYDFKISLIKPGVDTDNFFPSKEKISIRKKLNFPSNANMLIILGRIVKVKGIDLAIKAMSKINQKDTYLVVVGDGPETNALNALSIKLGVEENIIFYPSTDTPSMFFQAADAFLMSSVYEPFGQTILEAMSSGLPIIGFKSDGIRVMTATDEIVKDGENGFLCDYTIEALTDAIIRFLFLSREELKKIGLLNRKKVSDQYTWNHFCESLLEEIK